MFNRAEFTCHWRAGGEERGERRAKGKLVEWVASERKRTCVCLISRECRESAARKMPSAREATDRVREEIDMDKLLS